MNKYIILLPSVFLLSACSIKQDNINQSLVDNICQKYSNEYDISRCQDNLFRITPKQPTPGDGFMIIDQNLTENNCPVVAPDLITDICKQNLNCSLITCK